MSEIKKGNIKDLMDINKDGNKNGWFMGHFQGGKDKETRFVHSEDFEIKLEDVNKTKPDETNKEPIRANKTARSLTILLQGGSFELTTYRKGATPKTYKLENPGDYLFWEPNIGHTWRALGDSTMLTIRWPSVPGDQYDYEQNS